MKLVLQYKYIILIFLGIVGLYFLLRLPNLTLQPIFADEAIYIRWAQVMKSEPTLRFLPLSDGKTPLFMWILMPLFKVFEDPLFAGRFLSVISGFATLIGVFMLGWKVFNLRVGLVSALFYTVTPYTVFFDRMALVDSMLASFTIWALYFAIWLIKSQRLDLAMILGFLLGSALLVKTPAMINLVSLPFTLIGFNFKNRKKYSLLKLFLCWGIVSIIALGIYNLLRLGPGFYQLSSRNADYVFSLAELSGRYLDPFIPHFWDIADYFPKLLTWPVLVLGLVGIVRVVWGKNRLGIVILVWALIPLLLEMAFLRTFTARYLLSSIPPLLILAGYGFSFILKVVRGPVSSQPQNFPTALTSAGPHSGAPRSLPPLIAGMVLVVSLAVPLCIDYLLITNPEKVNLPRNERRGYFEEWTAGYGFPEITNFLIEKKKDGPVVVGTEGYFGTLPDGLQIYLDKSGIPVIGSNATISGQLRESAKQNQTFFVSNGNRLPGGLIGVKQISIYHKFKPLDDRPQNAIVLYQVL